MMYANDVHLMRVRLLVVRVDQSVRGASRSRRRASAASSQPVCAATARQEAGADVIYILMRHVAVNDGLTKTC